MNRIRIPKVRLTRHSLPIKRNEALPGDGPVAARIGLDKTVLVEGVSQDEAFVFLKEGSNLQKKIGLEEGIVSFVSGRFGRGGLGSARVTR